MNKKSSIGAIIAVVVVAVLALAAGYAWGNGTDNSSTSTTNGSATTSAADKASATAHNAADVMFLQMMVPHHEQATEMAKLADTRASSQDVKALATKIEAAQQPEIDKMNTWLETWGSDSSMSMNHGTGDMMSESDMKSLESSSGADFDKMFLQMMVSHHEGAIKMADSEIKDGKSADALALASSIAITQEAEVNQMKALLK